MSDLMLDVDQAGELKAAFRRGSWTNAEIKSACEGDKLAKFRQVILGNAEIVTVKHIIDCDSHPFVPVRNWEVRESDQLASRVTGQLEWNAANVGLFLSDTQKSDRHEGNQLRKELESQRVLPANVLDHLLKHPHLISEEYKGKHVFFWGTIYRDSDDDLCVRCLDWSGDGWGWGFDWLVFGFSGDYPAAVLAS